MTTTAQRFVELSGLDSGTAIQHLMAMETGGGTMPRVVEIEFFEKSSDGEKKDLFVLTRRESSVFVKDICIR